ncbi:hypothetical protein BH10PSE12_BH10PSE12_27150 [soil metagenome]
MRYGRDFLVHEGPFLRYPDLLRQPTRFATWPAGFAAGALALVVALILWGMAASSPAVGPSGGPLTPGAVSARTAKADPSGDDILLYRSIVAGIRNGGDYYTVTAPLLRDHHYPMRPFVTFRLPTLALMLAAMPDWLAIGLMAMLSAAVIIAWTVRLSPALRTPEISSWTSLVLLGGCLTAAGPMLLVFHESWAALLIALALALHRPAGTPGRWWPSVIAGLAAVMIRELALPFILLMGALALYAHRWTEAAAWAMVTLLFLFALMLHAGQVALVTLPGDPASPGWTSLGGWPFLIDSVRATTVLDYLPLALTATLVPLSLLGWAAWRSALGLATVLFLAGFACMMMLIGRPDNFYWAVMIEPLLLIGLVFTPAALRDLYRAAITSRRPLARA